MWSDLLYRIRAVFRHHAVEQELDQELRFHLERQIEMHVKSGLAHDEAARRARLALGGLDQVKEECRDARGVYLIETLMQDVRHGIRVLVKNPGFTLVAVLTLTLGIGVNTAIFSVVNGVLLQPLPYKEPNRLVAVWHKNRQEGNRLDSVSYLTFIDLQRDSGTFEELAGVSAVWSVILRGEEEPEQLAAHFVSASFFRLLGINPAPGRSFSQEEDRTNAAPHVVISYGLWQRRFGADPGISGKSITVDSFNATIVGVMPRGFKFFENADIWIPLALNPYVERGRGIRIVRVIGRLKPSLTIDQAQAEMTAITAHLEQQFPNTNSGLGASVIALNDQIVGKVRPALLVLLSAVGFVLLIACANVASLFLGRASVRAREIAVRAALGATRGRVIRQLLTESLLLAFLGGGMALALAWLGFDSVRALIPADLPRLEEVRIDGWVLGFTLVASLLTGLIFGVLPAMQVSKARLNDALREGGRTGTESGAGRQARSLLVIGEVALALMLLVGAGLMIRSFFRLMQVDPGFAADHLLTLQLMLDSKYPQESQRTVLYTQLFGGIESLPGVMAVGGTTRLPLRQGNPTQLEIEGRPVFEGARPEVEFRRASTGYFRAMGIPVRKGRSFVAEDTAAAPRVAVINETAARRFWPGEDPVGKRIRFFGGDASAPWWTIVGIVGDVKHFGLDKDASPEVYMHFSQGPPYNPLIAVRATSDPAALVPGVREKIRSVDKDIAIYNVQTMGQLVSESVSQRRFQMMLLGLFGTLALLLSATGVYGLMSYFVSRRTHEIGIRMALGASPRRVLGLVIGHGMLLAFAGIALGLCGAFALTRFLSTLLFGIETTDPGTFIAVSFLLSAVALIACHLPARRATKVDPISAIRCE